MVKSIGLGELRRCPFCGDYSGYETGMYEVKIYCRCGANIIVFIEGLPTMEKANRAQTEAIQRWNLRTTKGNRYNTREV